LVKSGGLLINAECRRLHRWREKEGLFDWDSLATYVVLSWDKTVNRNYDDLHLHLHLLILSQPLQPVRIYAKLKIETWDDWWELPRSRHISALGEGTEDD